MSQNELMRKNSVHSVDEESQKLPIIVAYEADIIDELKIQQKYKKLYSYIDYPICGNFSAPDLAPIRQKKRQLQKQFVDGEQKSQMKPLEAFDGLFQQVKQNHQITDNVFRQKIRMVRDVREEFFEQNGEFIIQKQFFSDSLSKIANISFDQNYAIKTLQKNAILSERNNQKKQSPFQIELSFGSLWFNKHPLNNEEEKKFEQIRPLLQEYARISTYPVLTEISKELKYLTLLRQNEDGIAGEELDRKIELMTNQYNEQKLRIETLMKKIIFENNELRQIRRNSLMETVPWRIHIKEYDYEGRSYYDIGVTSYEISDKIVAKSTSEAEIEQKRRKDIQEQEYFVKIYANENQIGKSEKVKLQWPSFRVQINQKFSIMVYNAPSSFKVQIIKSGIFNHVVDTIYLSIPGVNARTITSAEKRYAGISFCNNGKNYRTQLKNKKDDVKVDSQAPAGMLSYKLQWKGQSGKMPSINPKTSEQETACTEDTQIDETEQIQLIFDEKDPRMPHKNLKQKVQGQIKQRGNALLPFIDVQSARHLLLKLKSTLPQIQKIQIPLTEEQIRHRQDLLKIIENEKERRFQDLDTSAQQCFNPLEGIFANQPEIVLKEIREILNKAKTLKIWQVVATRQ